MSKIKKGLVKPTTMRFPPELKARVKSQAARENRTFANLAITLIREGLARRRPGKAETDVLA
jgi:predicted DNA-binding protein